MKILYSGHEEEHTKDIVLDKETAKALISWEPVNKPMITAPFQSRKSTIIQVYASTEETKDTKKGTFYELLQDMFNSIPSHDVKLLMGVLNAQLDSKR